MPIFTIPLIRMEDISPKYYITDNGKLFGPYIAGQQLSYKISEDAFAWCEGMNGWTSIGNIPDLYAGIVKRDPGSRYAKEIRKPVRKIILEIDFSHINNLIHIPVKKIKRISGRSKSIMTSLKSNLARFIP